VKKFVFAWFVSLAVWLTASAQPPPQSPLTDFTKLKEGDIVFIESNSERAPAIKKLTGSNLTHCGIVFRDQRNNWIVYEGAGRPYSYSDLADWIGRESGNGNKNPIYVRRLTDTNGRLNSKIENLRTKAKDLHDTSYDFGFAWKNKHPSGKEYIYCSELVWKAFNDAVGIALKNPHPLSEYIDKKRDDTQRTPAERKAVEDDFEIYLNNKKSKDHRDGRPYERSELAISPVEVFDSTELEAVTDGSPSSTLTPQP
jgi:hypothetical protein